MKEVYLVIEYEDRLYYLPFKDLVSVDEFTVCFDNLLELAASINDYLGLDYDNGKILDVYLSESIDKIDNDNQAYNKRYLAVKYKRDNFIRSEIEKVFIKYLKGQISNINDYSRLKMVFDNYYNKYIKDKKNYLEDKDRERIALLYLGDKYQRYKEVFFKLRDKGYKMKINEIKHDYTKKEQYEEDDKMLLTMFTGMNLGELRDFVLKQNEVGKKK